MGDLLMDLSETHMRGLHNAENTMAALAAFGLDVAYINDYGRALAATDVAAVGEVIAAVYPLPEDLVVVLLGDAETIRERAAGYGPLIEMSIAEPHFRPPASPEDD